MGFTWDESSPASAQRRSMFRAHIWHLYPWLVYTTARWPPWALHHHQPTAQVWPVPQWNHVLQNTQTYHSESHVLSLQTSSPPRWPVCCIAQLDQSAQTGCTISPKSALRAHWRQVGNKLVDLGDREGIVGRAAESDLGLNHIPNLCCFSVLAHKILPYSCSWANLGGFASSPGQSVQNGLKIKDSNWHIDFFITASTKGTSLFFFVTQVGHSAHAQQLRS